MRLIMADVCGTVEPNLTTLYTHESRRTGGHHITFYKHLPLAKEALSIRITMLVFPLSSLKFRFHIFTILQDPECPGHWARIITPGGARMRAPSSGCSQSAGAWAGRLQPVW